MQHLRPTDLVTRHTRRPPLLYVLLVSYDLWDCVMVRVANGIVLSEAGAGPVGSCERLQQKRFVKWLNAEATGPFVSHKSVAHFL